MNDIKEFKNLIKKVSSKRHIKVTNSYGIYDGFKYYRKIKPKDKKYVLTESQYFAITRKINDLLCIELMKGNDVKFPCKMGKLEILKTSSKIRFNNGKLKTNLPIDWDKTLELWYNDKEAYNNKILLRINEKELFKIKYIKRNANYKNQSYYEFNVNRELKQMLKKAIRNNEIDAPLLYI